MSEILQGLVTGQAVSSSNNSNNSSNSSNPINSLIGNNQNSGSNTSGSNGASISTPAINLNGNSNSSNQNNITSFNQNGVSIIADNAQNSLVVKADPQLMREIESAIQQLDVRRQQVLIDTQLLKSLEMMQINLEFNGHSVIYLVGLVYLALVM